MKKNFFYILIVVVLVVVLGFLGYFGVSKLNNNKEKEIIKEQEDNKEQAIVSLSLMKEFAKDEKLMIDLELITEVDVDSNIKMIVEDGYLFLIDNDNHKSKIKDFNEKVVALHSAFNSCVADFSDILILTEKGNLFLFKGLSNENFANNRITDEERRDLNSGRDVALNLIKVNKNNIKVFAFTRVPVNDNGAICNLDNYYVYTNLGLMHYESGDKVERIAKKEIHQNIKTFKNLVIYNDNSVSIKGENLLKTKLGDNLIVKDYIVVKNEIIYILGEDNLLYLMDMENNFSRKDIRVRELKRINKDIVEIYFVDGSNMKINLQGDLSNVLDDKSKKEINQKLERLYYPLREILSVEQESNLGDLKFDINYLEDETLLYKFIWTLSLASNLSSQKIGEDGVSYLYSDFNNYYKLLTNKEFDINKIDKSVLLDKEVPRVEENRIYGFYVTGWDNDLISLKVREINQNDLKLVIKADLLIDYDENGTYFDCNVLEYPNSLKKAGIEIICLKNKENYVIKSIILSKESGF